MAVKMINSDVMDGLAQLADSSVQCVVTSPPYWNLRDYGVDGQIGLEDTPEAFVDRLVDVFREVRRVLADDGVCWINIGDSYAGSWGAQLRGNDHPSGLEGSSTMSAGQIKAHPIGQTGVGSLKRTPGLKPKDLIGIPWRVALALQADGWWLRRDIIWSKPAPMPESVRDRCTSAHEYIFMLTKSAKYYYDAEAIRETATYLGPNGQQHSPYAQGFARRSAEEEKHRRGRKSGNKSHKYVDQYNAEDSEQHRTKAGLMAVSDKEWITRNKRSVWTIATRPFAEAHFATFPPELPEICIKASTRPGDTVLDPFGGAGTTGLVADRLQRNAILIELNPEYVAIAQRRIDEDRGELLDLMTEQQ